MRQTTRHGAKSGRRAAFLNDGPTVFQRQVKHPGGEVFSPLSELESLRIHAGKALLAEAVPIWERMHAEVESRLQGDADPVRAGLRALS